MCMISEAPRPFLTFPLFTAVLQTNFAYHFPKGCNAL